jgi:hypothetical protein
VTVDSLEPGTSQLCGTHDVALAVDSDGLLVVDVLDNRLLGDGLAHLGDDLGRRLLVVLVEEGLPGGGTSAGQRIGLRCERGGNEGSSRRRTLTASMLAVGWEREREGEEKRGG